MTYKPKTQIACIECGAAKTVGRKLCRRCYTRIAKDKRLHEYPVLGPRDVFEHRFEKTEGCWKWNGTHNGYGYGIFLMPGEKPVRAHRYSYEFYVGPIPEGMVIMHTCDNPPCVNPAHLRVGTKAENNADAAQKQRTNKGTKHWNCRLSDANIAAIRASDEPKAALAKRYGVDYSHIWRIKAGTHRR